MHTVQQSMNDCNCEKKVVSPERIGVSTAVALGISRKALGDAMPLVVLKTPWGETDSKSLFQMDVAQCKVSLLCAASLSK